MKGILEELWTSEREHLLRVLDSGDASFAKAADRYIYISKGSEALYFQFCK